MPTIDCSWIRGEGVVWVADRQEEIDALRARAEAAEERERGLQTDWQEVRALAVKVDERAEDRDMRGVMTLVSEIHRIALRHALATPPPPASREAAVIRAAKNYRATVATLRGWTETGSGEAGVSAVDTRDALFAALAALDGAGEPKEE